MNLRDHWDYIEYVATERLAHNKTSRHVENDGRLEIIGAAGELAARMFLGLEPRLGTHFDGGVDMHLGDLSIDVKATPMTSAVYYRYLQWPTWKPVKAQIIVATIVNTFLRDATIVGYATKAQILGAPVNETREIPCHEIAFWKLSAAWELTVQTDLRKRGVDCQIVGLAR